MKRKNFGIKGFDSMIEGGIPSGSIVGLSGPPGVGKSMFCLHYLLQGAKKGEKVLYINLEEPRSNIDNVLDSVSFGKKFRELEQKKLIVVKCLTYPEYEKVFMDLYEKINADDNIKRIVIDSFNIFFLSAINTESTTGSMISIRRMINQAFSYLRRKNLTSLLVLEKQSHDVNFQSSIPFLVDGMINLDFLDLGTIERRVFVPKMRWTDQYKESKAYEITKKGIVTE